MTVWIVVRHEGQKQMNAGVFSLESEAVECAKTWSAPHLKLKTDVYYDVEEHTVN